MIVNVWRLSRSIYYCLKLCCLHLILFTLIRIDAKSIVSQSLDGQDWIVYDSDKQCKLRSCSIEEILIAYFSLSLEKRSSFQQKFQDRSIPIYRGILYSENSIPISMMSNIVGFPISIGLI